MLTKKMITDALKKLKEESLNLPDANMGMFHTPTIMRITHQVDNLAAENERLKAKLDAVREAVEDWLEYSEWFEDDKLENILAIIDKDGDEG
jgi:division protein CdvB (Snf7/Vps24/ESCRT-III family)